ncbi:MAG: MCP four helix bundle domain-containing protein, partial [Pseudomonadota bacterium]
MKALTPEMSLSLRLGAGFALILLLMLALGAIGLGRLTEVNRRMEQIVNENNVKVEQAHIMK